MRFGLTTFFAAMWLGTTAFAGGPIVVVEEEEVVVEEKPASSVGLLPLLLIPVALCVVFCGDDEGSPSP